MLFTERISEWWPESRRHTQDSESTIILLPEGRFFERARDGSEVDLGRVRHWSEHRILLDFYIGTSPDMPTEVEITFTPEIAGTRVTVTHRPTPASSALWTSRAPRFAESWELVLAGLAATAT